MSRRNSKPDKAVEVKTERKAAVAGAPPRRGQRFEGQFFKTKMCMFWEKGQCTRGAECKYAHGDQELNETPNLTKTSLCKEQMTTGSCSNPNCLFAHGLEDLRATDKFFKTSMCSFFRAGTCRLGADCRHAHDVSELVTIPSTNQRRDDAALEPPRRPPLGRSDLRRRHRDLQRGNASVGKGDKQSFDDDDDFGDEPSLAWERTTTSPASFGWISTVPFRAMAKESADSSAAPAVSSAVAAKDLDSDDDFEDIMWSRMQTVPAPKQRNSMMGQAYGLDRGAYNPQLQAGMPVIPLVPQMMPRSFSNGAAEVGMMPPMMPQTPSNGHVMPDVLKGGYVDAQDAGPNKGVVMVPCVLVPMPVGPQGVQRDQIAMSNQMQANLLQSAMPEVYED